MALHKSVLRRIEALEAEVVAEARPFDLAQVCFPKQHPFVESNARFITAVCTRRSGKTTGLAAKLLHVARKKPGCVALYITRSRINAKRIFWRILKRMNLDFELGGLESEGELSITLRNGSVIYLAGCVDQGEIENFRGLPIGIVVLDEAQSLPAFIERLVDEVLAPALMDFDGQLCLVGTPGPVPVGYFHDCVQNPKWAHFQWSVFDNPYIEAKSGKRPEALLQEELDRRGVTMGDPTIQREWFGRWILDPNGLVFRYANDINAKTLAKPPQHFVIGVDLGFDDADAIAVLGWRDDSPEVELVYESVKAKQTVSALCDDVKRLHDKYEPLALLFDTGGLGKKIANEFQTRFGIPALAADKQRKLEHIELLNDALRTGRFYAPKDSRFATDCALVEWDKKNPEKWRISSQFHSDICDAVLYAYRQAMHWLHVPESPPPPPRGTPEALAKQKQEQEETQEQYWDDVAEANRNRREEEEAGWL